MRRDRNPTVRVPTWFAERVAEVQGTQGLTSAEAVEWLWREAKPRPRRRVARSRTRRPCLFGRHVWEHRVGVANRRAPGAREWFELHKCSRCGVRAWRELRAPLLDDYGCARDVIRGRRAYLVSEAPS